MIKAGNAEVLAQEVAELAMAITDDRHPFYRGISEDWNISNPEGYAKWFESRMRLAQRFLESRAMIEKATRIDDLPVYKWKTPLQRSIQILKRHRDVMFERVPDGKPISIIITTLAARAYGGELDLQSALEHILATMRILVNSSQPKVLNPVNPHEDFADRWGTEAGRRASLQQNFELWLEQACTDLEIVTSTQEKDLLSQQAMQKFGVALDERTLSAITSVTPRVVTFPKVHRVTDAAKPWCGG